MDDRGSSACGALSGIQKPAVLLQPMPVPWEARCHSCSQACVGSICNGDMHTYGA